MYMEAREFEDLPEERLKHIVRGISTGLKFLHDNCVIHRDIKPENILLSNSSNDSDSVIADFGLATVVEEGKPVTQLCGTRGYIAPEILQCQPYAYPVDVYSFGVLLYSLYLGRLPFPELAVKASRRNKSTISSIIEELELDFIDHKGK